MWSAWFSILFSDFSNFHKLRRGNLSSWKEPILQNGWVIWSPHLCFNFKRFKDPNYLSFIRHSAWIRSSFLRLLKFPQINGGGDLHSWGELFLQKGSIILSRLLYFIFKSFKDQNSSPFIRFQCISHDSRVNFSDLYIFYKLKRGDLISWGESILQNRLIICSLILYFNLKSFKDPNSSSVIRFQCILHDSGVPFSDFQKFHKLKTMGPNFLRGEPVL